MDSSQKRGSQAAIQKSKGFSMNPNLKVEHPDAFEAEYQMKYCKLVLEMRAPLVGYAVRSWAVVCAAKHLMNPRSHFLNLNNQQTLYGVEIAALAPGFSPIKIN
jgi:hypothetical protein